MVFITRSNELKFQVIEVQYSFKNWYKQGGTLFLKQNKGSSTDRVHIFNLNLFEFSLLDRYLCKYILVVSNSLAAVHYSIFHHSNTL